MNRSWLLPILVSAAAIGCCYLAAMAYRARSAAARSLAFASGLSERLASAERRLETAVNRASDQARRIAWLESRARREKPAPASPKPPESVNTPKVSMTERRHRVLTLAHKGLDAESIAEILGVPYGEVELIISLNAVCAGRTISSVLAPQESPFKTSAN